LDTEIQEKYNDSTLIALIHTACQLQVLLLKCRLYYIPIAIFQPNHVMYAGFETESGLAGNPT
jgi:hypothetical protein